MNTAYFTQVIDYQKTLFDNTYDTVVKLQEQGSQMVDWMVEKNALIPEDAKKQCAYWTDYFQQNQKNYKAYVDENFEKVKGYFQDLVRLLPRLSKNPNKRMPASKGRHKPF